MPDPLSASSPCSSCTRDQRAGRLPKFGVEAAYDGSEARQTPGRDAHVRRDEAKCGIVTVEDVKRIEDSGRDWRLGGPWGCGKAAKSSPGGPDEEGVNSGNTQGWERAAAGPASPKNPNGLDQGALVVSVARAFPLGRGGGVFCLIPAAAGDIMILY
jgi:hypothetical protein